ncbi:MAG TPA: potassium-transporting ATPase subunit C [Candidatus Bathyarchaeia archaeon]|nr:potassium-transporting ATPase subunit C [Candidatus Bathyarchaeia archaeon]
MSLKKQVKTIPGPALRLALVSLLICGIIFPLAVTGVAQLFLRDQANGSIAHYSNSTAVGSYLIAQNFSQPYFFHSRNATLSASGVDPDITLQDALNQIPRISNATGISQSDLTSLVNQHVEGTVWVFGNPYLNVLGLNIALVQTYKSFYCLKGYC